MVATRVVYVQTQPVYAPREHKIEAWDAILQRASPDTIRADLRALLRDGGYAWDEKAARWYVALEPDDSASEACDEI